jgi:hypothetical protein
MGLMGVVMKIIDDNWLDIDLSLKTGFVHVITSDNLIIQCCLEKRLDNKGFKKSINRFDNGMNDGICGDVNKKAFLKYGKNLCEKMLFYEMRKHKIVIR